MLQILDDVMDDDSSEEYNRLCRVEAPITEYLRDSAPNPMKYEAVQFSSM